MNTDESDSSTEIAEIEKFQIIQFIARGRKPVQRSVDIVPYSWITYDDIKKKYSCPFPSPPYTNLHEMVKGEVTPDPSWVKFTIVIKGQSSTYKEAVQKLKKLAVKDNLFTSDTDCDSKQKSAMLEKAFKIRQLENSLQKLKSTMEYDENSGVLNESPDTKSKKQTNQKKKKSPTKLKFKTDRAANSSKNRKRFFQTATSSEKDESYSASDNENNTSRESSTNKNHTNETSDSKLLGSKEVRPVNSTTLSISKSHHSHQESNHDDVAQPKSIVSLDENANNRKINTTSASVKNQVIGDVSNPRISMSKYVSGSTRPSTSTGISPQINESLFSLDISPTKLNAMLDEGSLSFSFDELLSKDIGATLPPAQKELDKLPVINNPINNNSTSKHTTDKNSVGKSLNITQKEYTILVQKLVYIEEEMKAQSTLMRNIEHLLQTKFGNPLGEKTLAEKYGTDFPVKSLNDLFTLEKRLSESLEARRDMKSTINMVVDPEEKLSKNMTVVIRKLIGREVAMQYTAIKKMDGKFVFKANVPTFCSCIVEALTSRLQITEAKVYAAMGTAFTNSKDWDGHRPIRVKKPSHDE